MLVVLPTQHLNMMNAWDGILGLISKISFINRLITFVIKYFYFKKKKFFAWPNIKAKKMIVPERIGNISSSKISKEVLFLIKNKDQLKRIRDNLLKERGGKGAAEKLAYMIFRLRPSTEVFTLTLLSPYFSYLTILIPVKVYVSPRLLSIKENEEVV